MPLADYNLKDQIRRLVDLQVIDEQVFHFKRELRDKPLQIEGLKKEFESKKMNLKALEDKLKSVQVNQKELELELKTKEEAIAKSDASLSQIKTNREYQARLLEIENLKADQSLVEEKILLGMDQVEEGRRVVEAERLRVAQYEKELNAQKKQIEDDCAVINDQLKVKESQRGRITPDIRTDYLASYERVLKNKDGLAIVNVVNHACGGCFMYLTEQVINELKKFEHLMICDMCARILYLDEEL